MNEFAAQLSFKINTPAGRLGAFSTPPSWPPTSDWVVSLDAQGRPLSRWGDIVWDFSPWVGRSCKINFLKTRGTISEGDLDPRNLTVLRLAITYLIWGPRGIKSWGTLTGVFNIVRRLVIYCDEMNVYVGDLSRFPKIFEGVRDLYTYGQGRKLLILTLHRLLRGADELGFVILDEYSITQVSKLFRELDDSETRQTAYIPPRIWHYQLIRLRECIDDFLVIADAFEECYNFCLIAYANNFGGLRNALGAVNISKTSLLPFSNKDVKRSAIGRIYPGTFEAVAKKYGIFDVLNKWVPSPSGAISVKILSNYAKLVQLASICYMCNFTLQRKEEVASLRLDCLLWEDDPILGKVAIIRGETTKTDPDSDARWPASPSVEVAVRAGGKLARMRMRCASEHPGISLSDYDISNPTILQYNAEPWSGRRDMESSGRITLMRYGEIVKKFPRLFDAEIIKITEEDIAIARMFTPGIEHDVNYAVGRAWPLAFHQLRRTSGINMFASGLLSASSIQVVMKHVSMLQTMYYGKNFSNCRFNEEAEAVASAARFEVLAKKIEALMEERYISPVSAARKSEIVVNLISGRDFKSLVRAGELGEVSFRETRLGGCAKSGFCEYGGIESVANCAGYEGMKPCREAIFDVGKRSAIAAQLLDVENRICNLSSDSPRKRALILEAQGMRSYLNVIEK